MPSFGAYEWVREALIDANDVLAFGMAGNAWPEGDEDALMELEGLLGQVGEALNSFTPEALAGAAEVYASYGGPTGAEIVDAFQEFVGTNDTGIFALFD